MVRGGPLSVQRRDPRFVRALVAKGEAELKIEFVNDVRGRVGAPVRHEGFGASSKAAGVFAADVARVLLGATAEDWRLVRWIPPAPAPEQFVGDLRALGEDLLLLR